jgi:hypothetical protein
VTIAAGNSGQFDDLPVLERYHVVIQNPDPTATGKWKVKVG